MTDANDPLPDWVKGLGLSARETAEQCRCTPRTVFNWRSGATKPTGNRRRLLMALLVSQKIVRSDLEFVPHELKRKTRKRKPRPPSPFPPERIEQLLAKLEWSNAEASRRSGIPRTTWTGWLKGRRTPSTAAVAYLKLLEQAAGITSDGTAGHA